MEAHEMTELALPASGSEPGSRAAMALNCAAMVGPKLLRECLRKAAKGDYCVRHWNANFGHELVYVSGVWRCRVCGVRLRGMDDEMCVEKVDPDSPESKWMAINPES